MFKTVSAKIIAVCVFIFICLVLMLINKTLTISKLKAENECLVTKLKTVEATVQNPSVEKEGRTVVKIVKHEVNLTEDEKEAICQQYEMKLAELNAVIEALTGTEVTIDKEGKSISKPVFQPSAIAKQNRFTVYTAIYKDVSELGLTYQIWKQGSIGLEVNDQFKYGGVASWKF